MQLKGSREQMVGPALTKEEALDRELYLDTYKDIVWKKLMMFNDIGHLMTIIDENENLAQRYQILRQELKLEIEEFIDEALDDLPEGWAEDMPESTVDKEELH